MPSLSNSTFAYAKSVFINWIGTCTCRAPVRLKTILLFFNLGTAGGATTEWEYGTMGEPWSMALDLWPEDGSIEVFDSEGKRIATIPIGFLGTARSDGAAMRSWSFVHDLLGDCVEEKGILCHQGGEHASTKTFSSDDMSSVIAGKYTFIPTGKRRPSKEQIHWVRKTITDQNISTCTPVQGPFGKRRGRKIRQDHDTSTTSDSKRSSIGQVKPAESLSTTRIADSRKDF